MKHTTKIFLYTEACLAIVGSALWYWLGVGRAIIILLSALCIAWLLAHESVLRRTRRIGLWLRRVNDPLLAAAHRQGGFFFDRDYMPLILLHSDWLDMISRHRTKLTLGTQCRILVALVNGETRDAGVLSPSKNRYLIYITASLFTTLYEHFARLVQRPDFMPKIGFETLDVPREQQDRLSLATKVAVTRFPELKDAPGRAALLVTLVHFALEFALLHEFAHVQLGHIDAIAKADGALGLNDRKSYVREPNASLRQRFEVSADELAAEFGILWVTLFDYKKAETQSATVIPGLLAGLPFSDKSAILECWLFSVGALFILIGLGEGDFRATERASHPYSAFRFERILRYCRRVGVLSNADDGRDWRGILGKVLPWMQSAGLPVGAFAANLEEFAASGLASKLEENVRNSHVADIIHTFPIQRRWRRKRARKFVRDVDVMAALDDLVKFLALAIGTPTEVRSSLDFAILMNTEAFRGLVASSGLRETLSDPREYDRLVEFPGDFRRGMILHEIARAQGLTVPDYRPPVGFTAEDVGREG
jgi:hypothetical protein